jgi:hypothetical protein
MSPSLSIGLDPEHGNTAEKNTDPMDANLNIVPTAGSW